jgi:Flp pilus assembly protein TadD
VAFAQIARVAVAALLLAGFQGHVYPQRSDLETANELFKRGQLDSALERVNAYLTGYPKDARGRFLKGVIFTEQKKTGDALGIFAGLTHDYPELPEPYNNLAVIYAAQGKYENARAALEMAIRVNPDHAAAYENLGDVYAKMAAQSYDKATKLDPNSKSTSTKLNLINEMLSKPNGQ